MVKRRDIRAFVNKLVGEFNPEKVILFGSYAYGKPTADSDVDLLVVMNHQDRKDVEQAIAIDVQLQRKFPLDLIVRRPAEIKKRLAMGDGFIRTIMGEGKVLYERHS